MDVLGTVTVMLVLVQLLAVAVTPSKSTVLVVAWLGPKPVPVIVTNVPIDPEFGLKLAMLGGVPEDGGLMVAAIALYEVVEVKLAVSDVPAALVVIWYSASAPEPSMAPRV